MAEGEGGKRVPGTDAQGGHSGLIVYGSGFALAALMTAGAFGAVAFHWLPPIALAPAILVLAIAQMLVHLVFFLRIDTSPDHNTNILALLFTLVIVAMVVLGTLWIMDHLNGNMMPMKDLMRMQR